MDRASTYLRVLRASLTQVERDSFAARGAVYDRLWQGVLQQMQADPACPPEEIETERAAFLQAVRTIEFGADRPLPYPDRDVVPPQPAPASDPGREHHSARDAERRTASSAAARRIVMAGGRRARRAIVVRMALACAVLVAAAAGYVLLATPTADQASWRAQAARLVQSIRDLFERDAAGPAAPVAAERAVLYAESRNEPAGKPFVGRAVWHSDRSKAARDGAKPAVSIAVEIPERKLTVTISLQRSAGEGSAMSHFVEFRFVGDAVANVLGILMKDEEQARGLELVGQVVPVRAGVFLMGLSAAEADARRNLMLLRSRNWLDIPIVLGDGSRHILTIEKGDSGREAIGGLLAASSQS